MCGCISGYNEAKAPPNSISIGNMVYNFQASTLLSSHTQCASHSVHPVRRHMCI